MTSLLDRVLDDQRQRALPAWMRSWPPLRPAKPESPLLTGEVTAESIGQMAVEYAHALDEWQDDLDDATAVEMAVALAGDLLDPPPPRLTDLLPRFKAKRGEIAFTLPLAIDVGDSTDPDAYRQEYDGAEIDDLIDTSFPPFRRDGIER